MRRLKWSRQRPCGSDIPVRLYPVLCGAGALALRSLYQGTSSDVPQGPQKATTRLQPRVSDSHFGSAGSKSVMLSYKCFLQREDNVRAMAIPIRRSDPANIAADLRTFFVTSSIAGKRRLLQSDGSAKLFIDVLYHYRSQTKFLLHDFVVMPDHFHVLITLRLGISIERAVQFIKGGFASRAGKEFGFKSLVWERGFSEVRIYLPDHLSRVQEYIACNPVKRWLAKKPDEYPFSSSHPGFQLDGVPQGLKPSAKVATIRHV
jgi:putative transposase